MYFVKPKDVSDFDVAKMRHGEKVARGQNVFFACEGCDHVLRGL